MYSILNNFKCNYFHYCNKNVVLLFYVVLCCFILFIAIQLKKKLSEDALNGLDDKETKQIDMLNNEEQSDSELLNEICILLGLKDKKLITLYLQNKKIELLGKYECIGDVTLKMSDYVRHGIYGLFDYVKQATKAKVPLVPFAFPCNLLKDCSQIKCLSEDNLWCLKKYSLDMEMIAERTTFWKVFINTISKSLGDYEKKNTIDQDSWDSLSKMMQKLWNNKAIEPFKYMNKKVTKKQKESSDNRHSVLSAYTKNYNNNRGSSNNNNYQRETATGNNTNRVYIFSSNKFEECIWSVIDTYWKQPREKLLSQTIGKDRDRKLVEQINGDREKREIAARGHIQIQK